MSHAAHEVEAEWSPTNSGAIRVTCRVCGAYQEAWVTRDDSGILYYEAVWAARRQAKKWLLETCCVPVHQGATP